MKGIRARAALAIGLVTLALVPLLFLPDRRHIFTMLDAVTTTVGTTVAYVFLAGLFGRNRDRGVSPAAYLLVLGIAIVAAGWVGRIWWLFAWRLAGRPDWMMDHWVIIGTLYLLIVGGCLHLIAHKAIDDQIPRSGWVNLAGAVVTGLLLGFGLIWAFGDLTPVIEGSSRLLMR